MVKGVDLETTPLDRLYWCPDKKDVPNPMQGTEFRQHMKTCEPCQERILGNKNAKEKEKSKWDAPILKGGVVLEGSRCPLHSPGPHRSFSYTIHSGFQTGYQTIQTCDIVQNPFTQEKQ